MSSWHDVLITASLAAALLQGASTAQTLYGVATPGTGGIEPEAWLRETAWPGNSSFQLTLDSAVGGAPALIAIGAQRGAFPVVGIQLNTLPLFALSVGSTSGMPGVGGAGTAQLAVPVPNRPSLVGKAIDFQWVVLDGGAASGLSATRGLEVLIRRPPLVLACGSASSLDPVFAIDPQSGTITNWQAQVGANNPNDVQFSPSGDIAVVSAALSRQFIIVDADNGGARLAHISLSGSPNASAITPDGERAYGIVGGTQGSPAGTIIEFGVAPGSLAFGQQIGTVTGLPASFSQLEGVGISKDGTTLTACTLGLAGSPAIAVVDIDRQSPTFNQVRLVIPLFGLITDVEPDADGSRAFVAVAALGGPSELLIVDTGTGAILKRVQGLGDFATDVDLGPRCRHAYVATPNSNSVARVAIDPGDPAYGTFINSIGQIGRPFSVAVAKDGSKVYAAEDGGDKVHELDSSTMRLLRSFAVGRGAGAGVDVR